MTRPSLSARVLGIRLKLFVPPFVKEFDLFLSKDLILQAQGRLGPVSPTTQGALDGASPMLHVDFKKCPFPLSLLIQFSCHFQKGPILHVEFKKYPMSCRFYVFSHH